MAAASVPAPAHAEDITDYAIGVDPRAKGAKIDDTMYGVFFEDINRAADGGLYAELVQNRSFEYSTVDNRACTPLTSWAVDGTAQVVNDAGRLNERNRNYLSLGAGSAVTNAGCNTGVHVEEGKKYDFSVRAAGSASARTSGRTRRGAVGPRGAAADDTSRAPDRACGPSRAAMSGGGAFRACRRSWRSCRRTSRPGGCGRSACRCRGAWASVAPSAVASSPPGASPGPASC